MARGISITRTDYERLSEMIRDLIASGVPRREVAALEEELASAEIVESGAVAGDVITMRSEARLRDLATGEEMVYVLSYPDETDIDRNRISVLAPVGTAILGYRVGDTITWKVPGGTRELRVEEVCYQPEAAGDLDL